MQTAEDAPRYYVWGLDDVAYGPAELTALTKWVMDERVVADTWVFSKEKQTWLKANQMEELAIFFREGAHANRSRDDRSARLSGIKSGSLRRIKLLAGMEERQLESFLNYMEVVDVKPFAEVFKKGENSDAMYLVLEGELRARMMVDKKETTLSTMSAGDFFGEIALLDHGPRSADVIANTDSRLLKISSVSFERVLAEAPALAASFLYALSKSVGARVRVLTNKYQDSIHFSRLGSVVR